MRARCACQGLRESTERPSAQARLRAHVLDDGIACLPGSRPTARARRRAVRCDSQHCSEGERRADAVVLADAEIAARRLGQPPTNHQPEPRPAVRPGSGAVDLDEGLEQPVHPAPGKAMPVSRTDTVSRTDFAAGPGSSCPVTVTSTLPLSVNFTALLSKLMITCLLYTS